MRTTVTLDPDADALVRKLMKERGIGFKEALNFAVRAGLSAPHAGGGETPTFDLGAPTVPIEKALELAGALENEELTRKLALRK